MLALLPTELTRDGLVAVAYSLGDAMLLKYLGEEGQSSSLSAAAAISAPIDLAVADRYMLRSSNFAYHRFVLGKMKRHVSGEGSAHRPIIAPHCWNRRRFENTTINSLHLGTALLALKTITSDPSLYVSWETFAFRR